MNQSNSALNRLFADDGTPDPEPAPRRSKRRRGLKRVLILITVLLVLLGLVVGIGYALLASTYNEVDRVSIEQDPEWQRPAEATGDDAPINILLLGSDSRETTDPGATIEDLGDFRSDAIMVAQISPEDDSITVMSIMRDNWVNIEGHGEAKINAAVAYGGLPLAVNSVENFIGARIDHVALIDFDSFKGLTDAVGGVTIDNPIEYTAQNGGGDFTFAEGEITLDGDQALSYVRERYAFSDGDYQRVRNQQVYLQALFGQLLSSETLGSVDRVTSVFESLKPYLILDEGLNLNRTVMLGIDMRSIRSNDISFFTSPTNGTGTSADGQSIVIPDETELENVRTAFADGTLDEYAAAQE
ncbi:LCP family protein [Leucobacter tardus]|uniref:LCP family protein n=1 Tax=Leucobacter tardus TaxID=501483 RepID=A0A939QFW4_9MICO|nr:LCP family protein [Leucobacter tardus]MBO2989408.1 LCP family protein [Leucobacter tardus]